MGFVKFILILVIVYYSLKLIGRYVLPWLLGRLIKKMQNQQGFYFGPGQQQTTEPDGKVTVQYQRKERTKQTSEGEYVDYEEIK